MLVCHGDSVASVTSPTKTSKVAGGDNRTTLERAYMVDTVHQMRTNGDETMRMARAARKEFLRAFESSRMDNPRSPSPKPLKVIWEQSPNPDKHALLRAVRMMFKR
jgi:hypothetical protein